MDNTLSTNPLTDNTLSTKIVSEKIPLTADYAILVLDRETEDDPNDGIVIYTRDGSHWHAMVTGHMDYCREVMDALCYKEYDIAEKQAESLARLKEELNNG